MQSSYDADFNSGLETLETSVKIAGVSNFFFLSMLMAFLINPTLPTAALFVIETDDEKDHKEAELLM